jgi:hypothetical protein
LQAEIWRLLEDLGNDAIAKDGDCKVQEVDREAEISKNPIEFTKTHRVLEVCPFVLLRFDVWVGWKEPDAEAVMEAAVAEGQTLAELWDLSLKQRVCTMLVVGL